VAFYDTLAEARRDLSNLEVKAADCGQLNIVVRTDGDMSDEALERVGKLYVGAAWALIHDRRVEEGWYNEKH
jgi:hypothetical protein